MKFGNFELQGRTFYGIVEGDQVVELDGSIFDSYKTTSKKHELSSLKTLLPCRPANFYCAGINYVAHIEWGNKRKGTNTKPPTKADIGYRSPSALCATGETIVIPADAPGPIQYEGELVAVVGIVSGKTVTVAATPQTSGIMVIWNGSAWVSTA